MHKQQEPAYWSVIPPELLLNIFSFIDSHTLLCTFHVCQSWRLIAGVHITFRIHYNTQFGEDLLVVGDTSMIGKWKVENGLKMKWVQGGWWQGDTLLPVEKEVNYKYVLARNGLPMVWDHGVSCCILFFLHLFFHLDCRLIEKEDSIESRQGLK